MAGEVFYLVLGISPAAGGVKHLCSLAVSISLIRSRSYVAFLVQLSLTSSAFALGFVSLDCDYSIHLFSCNVNRVLHFFSCKVAQKMLFFLCNITLDFVYYLSYNNGKVVRECLLKIAAPPIRKELKRASCL